MMKGWTKLPDWEDMNAEACQRKSNGELIPSGTYNYTARVERDGKFYAVRVAQKAEEGFGVPFNDLEMVEDPYMNLGSLVDQLQQGEPKFFIPDLYYVSERFLDPEGGNGGRKAFAVFDWVPDSKFATQLPGYKFGSLLPDSLSVGLDDYFSRWTKIPLHEVNLKSEWRGENQRELTLAHLHHARKQYEACRPEMSKILELLKFPKDPFKRLEEEFSNMDERAPCFIEVDRNLENVLYVAGDSSKYPVFIDIDNHMVGDFVYGVIANEHRMGINLQEIERVKRRERLIEGIDPSYTSGWESAAPIFDEFELVRNSIRRILVIKQEFQKTKQAEVPQKFIDCYNHLRQKFWNKAPFSAEHFHEIFSHINKNVVPVDRGSVYDQADGSFLGEISAERLRD